ncbi:hypothetical protein [Corynebacterium sp. J010B-136]|uniref:hypothetical protein n=1 Tax=Corynebacterium sp. J010B-136 TaxID=2099401 RepID=UPI000CF84FDC|nr:hypothetical protein [Corynebacterium sp. J010B-136]PQM75257.1 hypothetical protein C5Y44_00290 [Corynebacterium sp. J010B-136]
MKYTSWDRSDRDNPKLLVEEGPETLGTFSAGSADINGDFWRLSVDEKLGASATTSDDRVFRISGDLNKDKKLDVSLDGRTFTIVNENSNDWIIDDVNENFVAQFSGRNNGVRKVNLEFMHDDKIELSTEEIAALSWFARLILENRLKKSSVAMIATLLLASAVAVVAFLL